MTDRKPHTDARLRAPSQNDVGRLHLDSGRQEWPLRLAGKQYSFLDIIGDGKLLDRLLTAIFCSSKCTGSAILAATHWVAELAEDSSRTFIGGFHSAIEKSLLEILLDGKCQIVVCPARSLDRFRIPAALRTPIESGRLAVVSSLPQTVRSNSASSSRQRNQFVADLADHIVVAHAAVGSRTEQFALELLRAGTQVHCLAVGCESLTSAGAKVLHVGETDGRNLR